jgi:hypothetical protein
MSYMTLVFEFFTVAQPYDAGAVSCTMMVPSAPRRHLFILVGPAAVVGHGLAAEVAHARFKVGIVDQHHRQFAAQVEAFEVVPLALGRIHAIADEHQRRIAEIDLFAAVHGGAHGHVVALFQLLIAFGVMQLQLDGAFDFETAQRHILRPAAHILLALEQIAAGCRPAALNCSIR